MDNRFDVAGYVRELENRIAKGKPKLATQTRFSGQNHHEPLTDKMVDNIVDDYITNPTRRD